MRRLLAAGALLLLAACASPDATGDAIGGGPVGVGGPAGTSAPASATASAGASAQASAAVLKGYADYWTALLHAHAAGNPDDPGLSDHATGTALADAQSGIRTDIARGVRLRGPVTHKPALRKVGSDSAVVVDCVDLRRWVAYDTPSGQRDVSIRPAGRITATYTLAVEEGAWKVSTAEQGTFC